MPHSSMGCLCVLQVMVFVHARNATVRTATVLRDMAKNEGTISSFIADQSPQLGAVQKQVGGTLMCVS